MWIRILQLYKPDGDIDVWHIEVNVFDKERLLVTRKLLLL